MRFLKVRDMDGHIMGETMEGREYEPGAGLTTRSTEDPTVVADTHFWNGTEFALRTLLSEKFVRAERGQSNSLFLTNAEYTVLDGEAVPTNGARTVTFDISADFRLQETGPYKGTITIWVKTIQEWEDYWCGLVDQKAEELQSTALTEGEAKKTAYGAKQAEFINYTQLGAAAVDALDDTTKRIYFRYAMAEVDVSGETLAQVIARFGDGIDSSTPDIARWEAIAVVGKRNIRAATGLGPKQNAYNAISWE
jgi:hypothetical protein